MPVEGPDGTSPLSERFQGALHRPFWIVDDRTALADEIRWGRETTIVPPRERDPREDRQRYLVAQRCSSLAMPGPHKKLSRPFPTFWSWPYLLKSYANISDIFVLLLQIALALIHEPNVDLFHRASLMQMFLRVLK